MDVTCSMDLIVSIIKLIIFEKTIEIAISQEALYLI